MATEKAKERAEVTKVKWLLENYNRACRRQSSLESTLRSVEFSTKAATAVGGSGSGSSDSDQEKFVEMKENMQEEKLILEQCTNAIEGNVDGLPEKLEATIKLKYFHELTDEEAGKRLEPKVGDRTIRNYKEEAVQQLVDPKLMMIYDLLVIALED